MRKVGLETFEILPSLSKRAKSKIIWLEIELKAHHPLGKELSATRIKQWKGLSGTEVRGMVHRLRLGGYPIGSNVKGYFWAFKWEELETTVRHLNQRINSIDEVRSILEKTLRLMKKESSQIGMFK